LSIPYTRGLHELGQGVYAWLQPDGGWGWSNAGLVTSAGESLLVDTLFDLRLTREMLEAMRAASPAARQLSTVVNTHANGDHTLGNQLVGDAVIVASEGTTEQMKTGLNPATLAAAKARAAEHGSLGRWLLHAYGPFDLEGIKVRLPDQTFSGELRLTVGDLKLELYEVGPAHTQGDTLVWVPERSLLYAGDIVFSGSHPVIWAGPVSNWMAALDRILALGPSVVVPGHGAVTDLSCVRELKDYLVDLSAEVRRRWEAGMAPLDASRDLPLSRYAAWSERERLAANVLALYAEFEGHPPPPTMEVNQAMADFGGF
jgi:glyoxylase-like metal-dependent hydrolase (beta-lactamase superfamily II)